MRTQPAVRNAGRRGLRPGWRAATVLITALAASAATAAPDPPEQIAFPSSVTVVALPVFVTDRDGRSAAGLTEADFEVRDDGKPVEIVGFRAIDAADPHGAEVLRESPAARRQFLLLFDLSFTGVDGLVRSRQAAGRFVRETLQDTDLAAVATFSALHGLNFLTGFTSDRVQLSRAIDTLGVLQLDRQADPLQLAFDLGELGAMVTDALPEEKPGAVNEALAPLQVRFRQSEETFYRQRVLALVDSLGQLGRLLDSLQGRKQVLFLSSGFDDTVLMGAVGTQSTRDSEAIVRGRSWEVSSPQRFGDSEVRDALARALGAFSASDAVVHSIDLAGLSTSGDTRQQNAMPSRHVGRESLAEIAELSGGRLFQNTNDLDRVFADVAELSRHYYLLAFEPRDPRGPGKFHKVRVRVRGDGLRASHRSGYLERAAPGEEPLLARRFEAAEIIAKEMEVDEIPLGALVLPYRPTGDHVVLSVVLEPERSAFRPGAASPTELEAYGYAFDEAGTVQDMAAQFWRLPAGFAGSEGGDGGVQLHLTFRLRPGLYHLRFLVQDVSAGRRGAKWLEVRVPAPDPGELFVAPPVVIDRQARPRVLEVASRSSGGVSATPFRTSSSFVPEVRPRLVNGQAQSVCVMAFDGGRHYDPGASFQITPGLRDGSGHPVALGRVTLSESIADDEGFRRFVLDFTPHDVPPGAYRLRIGLRDPGSGRVSEVYQSVTVE